MHPYCPLSLCRIMQMSRCILLPLVVRVSWTTGCKCRILPVARFNAAATGPWQRNCGTKVGYRAHSRRRPYAFRIGGEAGVWRSFEGLLETATSSTSCPIVTSHTSLRLLHSSQSSLYPIVSALPVSERNGLLIPRYYNQIPAPLFSGCALGIGPSQLWYASPAEPCRH